MQVKSRHHLRSDGIRDLERTLADRFGIDLDGETYERVAFVDEEREVVLVDGEPTAMYVDDEPTLTVRGANRFPPDKRVVVVDGGAISFVSDGANVMRPGIVAADKTIEPGDVVTIEEDTHGKTLAIGRAQVDGPEMTGDSGMVVESIHHVGDDLYETTF